MQSGLLESLSRLADDELVSAVKAIAARERGATALLVAHLAELGKRDLHLRTGHSSLFSYCRVELHLSEQEAFNRTSVARTARRFPVVLELLESGALNLTAVRLLGPHLTPQNHQAVLESARGKTKLQVEELAAALAPVPDAPSSIRKLPSASWATKGGVASSAPTHRSQGSNAAPSGLSHTPTAPSGTAAPGLSLGTSPSGTSPSGTSHSGSSPSGSSASGSSAPGPSGQPTGGPITDGYSALSWGASAGPTPPPATAGATSTHSPPPGWPTTGATRPAAQVTPLSPDRYRVQVTIGSDTLEKLKLAKDLLRHAVPSGDEAVILDRALTALLSDLAEKRFAAVERPRQPHAPSSGSRHIPADVKRQVWLRDVGRCAFVASNGRRCEARGFLEFHHLIPYSQGGEATTGNIQLRCRAHNALEARLYFGDGNGHGAETVREPVGPYRVPAPTRSGTSEPPRVARPAGMKRGRVSFQLRSRAVTRRSAWDSAG